MKNINRFAKTIVLFIAVFTAINNVYADGIAGPDKRIPLKRGGGEPEPVTLTAQGGNGTCCFNWTTSDGEILSDPDQQSIQIKPKSPKSTFHVTRSCADGSESGLVTVYYEDFTIVSVKPKYKCYKALASVDVNEYDVVTSPEGYESYVKNDTWKYPPLLSPVATSEHREIWFEKTAGEPQKISTTVLVVDEHRTVTLSGGSMEVLDKLKGYAGTLNNKMNFIAGKFGSKYIRADEFKIDYSSDVKIKELCCPNVRRPEDGIKLSLSFKGSGGISGDIPTPWHIPGLGGFSVRLSGKASLTVSGTLESGCDENAACLGLSAGLSFSVAAALTVIDPALLDASIGVEIPITIGEGKICKPLENSALGLICIEAKLFAKVKLLSFFTDTYELKIIDKTCVYEK